MHTTPAEIAQRVGGHLEGDGGLAIHRIAPLDRADAQSVSFLSNPKYRSQLHSTQAACVLVAERLRPLDGLQLPSVVWVPDPYLAYAQLSQWWAHAQRPVAPPGIHPMAVVEEGAQVHPSAHVAALAHVGRHAKVGAGAFIGPHCLLGEGAEVGEGTRFTSSVTLHAGCRIGAHGLVHSGAVIGADGFGFAPAQGTWVKIEQLGGVRIGDHVEIGANTCIDRGALDDTVIEDHVKLDNLIQIAHNVHIGRGTAMAGCAGVAGSARIGQRCTIGGSANILGHLTLVDDVHVSVATVVTRSILQPGVYSGSFPFDDNAAWEKNAATLRQLHAMRQRLRELERRLT